MKRPITILHFVLLVAFGLPAATGAQLSNLTPEELQRLLQRYPAADANRDGILTVPEAQAYHAKLRGAKAEAPRPQRAPAPTMADVSYGADGRNVLDFWQAKAKRGRPTPLVIFFHGGGFHSGDKSKARENKLVKEFLDAGVSFASINYRYLSETVPLQDVLRDCARAVQFIRSKAGEWNIDKARIASFGTSAGAGTSLWLAFHDDMADPENPDPVLRESTRLVCAGSLSGQFSYDFPQWREVFGDEAVDRFGGRYKSPGIYGLKTEEDLRGPLGRQIRGELDMLALMSADDPPFFVSVSLPDLALTNSSQFLHHPKHSELLVERGRNLGLTVVAEISALDISPAKGEPATWRDFAFKHLGVKRK